MEKKYIYIRGQRIDVSDKVYRVYKNQQNRENYLNKLEKDYRLFQYANQDFDIEDIADESIDVEKIIEAKMRIDDLYKALSKLNTDERNLINSIYFKEKTIRELAEERKVSTKKYLI